MAAHQEDRHFEALRHPVKRLGAASLVGMPRGSTAGGVLLPRYDRAEVGVGVVHIGPGAFFRAHQASYVDRLLSSDPRWGIAAISLNTATVRDALAPQDGLYTLAEIGPSPAMRVIGAVKRLIVAPEAPSATLAALASPAVRLVTVTVTEKGYHLTAGGELDLDSPAVAHDLAQPREPPKSLVGWLAKALAKRRASNAPSLTVLSCDNLEDNGGSLARAVHRFADARGERDLAAWLEAQVRFPRTMVDSITPATDDALRHLVDRSLGLHDAWPVHREPFLQWVIEDDLADGAPDLAAAGAVITGDVAPFERVKLRLLNGAHSTLAYVGRLAGLETVAQAMAQPEIGAFVERLMRDSIAPTLTPSRDLNVSSYIGEVLGRFRNQALRHELAQIAWDGSKKLPPRLLGTAADLLARGADLSAIAIPIVAWMRFVRLQAHTGAPLVDPVAADLTARLRDGGPEEALCFLDCRAVFPTALSAAAPFREAVLAAHASLALSPLGALRV